MMTKLQIYKHLMYKPLTRIDLIGFILTMMSFLVWYDFWNENVLGAIFLVTFVRCAILFTEDYMEKQVSEEGNDETKW